MAYDGTIRIDTKIDTDGIKKGMSKAGDIVKGIGKVVAGVGATMVTMGAAATKVGMDYETAFAGVRKTVDETVNTSFEDLSNGIRQMAQEIPMAATEIAGIAESAGQLGIETDNILDFTRVMADLGVATNLTGEEAAVTFAQFANITGMAQTDFDRLGSTLVELGNNLATDEASIASMSMRLAGAGTQAGLTEHEILGFAGALSSVGIEAEAGGSSFSKLMSEMQLAVETNSPKLEEFARVAGMTGEEFQTAFRDNAAGAIQGFVVGLDDFDRHGKSAVELLDDMNIKEIRMRDTLLRASGARDTFNRSLEMSATAWEENIALTEEADAAYDTLASQLQMLWSSVKDMGIEFAESINDGLRETVDSVRSGVDEIATALKEGGVQGAASALGNVLATWVTDIAQAVPSVLASATGLVMSFIGGIRSNFPDITQAAVDIGVTLVESVIEVFPELVEVGLEAIMHLGEGLAEAIPELIPVIVDVVLGIVQTLLDNIPQLIDTGVELILALVEGLLNAIPVLLETMPKIMESIVTGLQGAIPQLGNAAMQIILSLADFLLNNLPLVIETAIKIVGALATGLINAIPQLVESALSIVTGLIRFIVNNFPKLITAGVDMVLAIGKGIVSSVFEAVNAMKEVITGLWDSFMNMEWGELGRAVIDGIVNSIKNGLNRVWESAKELGNSVMNGVKGVLGISSPSKEFIKIGGEVVAGAEIGINKHARNAIQASKDMAERALQAANMSRYSMAGAYAPMPVSAAGDTTDNSIVFSKGAFDFTGTTIASDYDVDRLMDRVDYNIKRRKREVGAW